MNNSIFDTIKQTIDKEKFKDFVNSVYDLEFKGGNGNAFCPFHSHNYDTPSLGISEKDGTAFFNCFACNTAGDIVKFVELKEGCSPSEAAKKVCDYFGIPCAIHTKQMSEEEKRAQDEHLKALKAESEKRAKDQQADRDKRIKQTLTRLRSIAPALISNKQNNYEIVSPLIEASFPFYFSDNFKAYAADIVGYSFEHKSLAIIIRDEKGEPFNIRYREKYAWDEKQKALSYERMSGKWVGEPVIPAYPFPLKYFLEHTDDRVIICEGEKDALNLLSFNVRCLTLGGVGAKFDEKYKDLLKNKIVYIWFDNDEAGYGNAVKRYCELQDVAREIYIVLFYAISKNLPNKYDISDFISENMPNLGTTNIYDLIAFSCFKPTNVIIDEICDYYPNLTKQLAEFRQLEPLKDFGDVKAEIMQKDKDGRYLNIFDVKGQLDDQYVDEVLKNAKLLKSEIGDGRYKLLKELYLKNFVMNETEQENFERWSKAFDEAFKVSKTMRTNYHQTHIVDMVSSLNQTFLKLGYRLGEYKGNLHIWASNYFLKIDTNSLAKFIHSSWMSAAGVDKKKQTRPNTDLIVGDLISLALNLDEIKAREPRRVINMLNGTIFVSKSGKITFKPKHDYKDAATNILKFNFDKNAKCHKWDRFLSQVMSDEDDKKTLMEFIGYCLLPSHDYESFLFLYGKSGANGKSVILDTLKSFFGDENISALQLQQFEGHQLHALTNKFINIGSEIDKNGTDKGQLSNLKAIVSPKDNLQINPKNQEPYLLLPNEKPKLAFAGNEKPRQGLDNAVFRRMLLISFDKEIKDGQKIRGLSDRFTDELADIFNLALAGLERLIKQGKFTRSKRMTNELEEYKDDVNPLRAFARDMLVADEKYYIPNIYLYKVYMQFITDKGGKPISSKRFYSSLRDELMMNNITISFGRKRISNFTVQPGLSSVPNCTFGIKFSEDLEFDAVNIDGATVLTSSMSFYDKNGAKSDE